MKALPKGLLGLCLLVLSQGLLIAVYYAPEEVPQAGNDEEGFVYEAAGVRDPFLPLFISTPTPTWVPTATPTPITMDGVTVVELTPTPTPIPTPELLLEGILYSRRRPIAIINSQVLLPGEFIDGARVVQIDRRAVYLNYEGLSFRLLPEEEDTIVIE
jgi:hypothetical protein